MKCPICTLQLVQELDCDPELFAGRRPLVGETVDAGEIVELCAGDELHCPACRTLLRLIESLPDGPRELVVAT